MPLGSARPNKGLAKAAGVEPSWPRNLKSKPPRRKADKSKHFSRRARLEVDVRKVHAAGVQSTFGSLPPLLEIEMFRKHILKSKCTKARHVPATLRD